MTRILTLDLGNTSLGGMLWNQAQMRLGFRLRAGETPSPALLILP